LETKLSITLQNSEETAIIDSKTTLEAVISADSASCRSEWDKIRTVREQEIAADSASCKSEWDKIRTIREQENLRMQSSLDSLLSDTIATLTDKAMLTSTIQSLSDEVVATSQSELSEETAGFSSALKTCNATILMGLDQRLIDSRAATYLAKEVAVRDISTALTTALDTFAIESLSGSTGQGKRKKRPKPRVRIAGAGDHGGDDDDG